MADGDPGWIILTRAMSVELELIVDLMQHLDEINHCIKEETYRLMSNKLKQLYDHTGNQTELNTLIVLYRKCEQELYRAHLKKWDPHTNAGHHQECIKLEEERRYHMHLLEKAGFECEIEVCYDASERKINLI